MKLYRYMSLEEFSKLTSGCMLTNTTKWGGECRSTSEGFCFLPESAKTDWEGRSANPVEAISFLSGVVSTACFNTSSWYYLLVEMECTTPEVLTEGEGIYAVPFRWGAAYDDRMGVQEFSCTSYSRDTFIPTRYALIENEKTATWYDTNVIPDFVIASCEVKDGWYDEGDIIKVGRYRATIRPRVHH